MKILFAGFITFFTCLALLPAGTVAQTTDEKPLEIAIVGLVHDHINGFMRGALGRKDIEVVGVYDADPELLAKYGERYDLPADIRYSSLDRLFEERHPEAITLFTNTFDHAAMVEWAADRGIHVMMEKPLAVSMQHAETIEKAARSGGIHVLVNYETTWYPTNAEAYRLSEAGALGALRKIVVHDGHFGPKEIGVSDVFLEWLVDPVLNGGGALTDFGCYGANLMTWLMKGEIPVSVVAVTQQMKDDPVYSRADDETTIIVEYEKAQGIIQASWNWPYHRKDMEVYGDSGRVIALNRNDLLVAGHNAQLVESRPDPLEASHADPLSYLKAVVRGEVDPAPHDLSSLQNNIVVTRILDAARESAAKGERIWIRK